MKTDELIDRLASDLGPVPRCARGLRLALGIVGGGAVTLALIAALLGFRHDLTHAMHGFAFWMKWAYAISLGVGAVALWFRVPAVLAMLIAAIVCALLRLIT